jgi:hypothetical protein
MFTTMLCLSAGPDTWRLLAGYLLGGIAWFAIPFSMATSLGLAARALDLPISLSESNAGGPSCLPPAVRQQMSATTAP